MYGAVCDMKKIAQLKNISCRLLKIVLNVFLEKTIKEELQAQ